MFNDEIGLRSIRTYCEARIAEMKEFGLESSYYKKILAMLGCDEVVA